MNFYLFLKPHYLTSWLSLQLNYWGRRCFRQNCFWNQHLNIFFCCYWNLPYNKPVLKLPNYIIIFAHVYYLNKDLICTGKRIYTHWNYLAIVPLVGNFETRLKPFFLKPFYVKPEQGPPSPKIIQDVSGGPISLYVTQPLKSG